MILVPFFILPYLVHDETKRPYVHFGVIYPGFAIVRHHLGSHITIGANITCVFKLSQIRETPMRFVHNLGDTEIRDLDGIVFTDKYIRWFQISMDHAFWFSFMKIDQT